MASNTGSSETKAPANGKKPTAKKAAPKKAVTPEVASAAAAPAAPTSLGQSFGEMVWLLTQNPIHKGLKLKMQRVDAKTGEKTVLELGGEG